MTENFARALERHFLAIDPKYRIGDEEAKAYFDALAAWLDEVDQNEQAAAEAKKKKLDDETRETIKDCIILMPLAAALLYFMHVAGLTI